MLRFRLDIYELSYYICCYYLGYISRLPKRINDLVPPKVSVCEDQSKSTPPPRFGLGVPVVPTPAIGQSNIGI